MKDKIEILKKYNFNNNSLPDAGFERNKYLDRISGFYGNRLIKVLVGQRKVYCQHGRHSVAGE